MTQALYNKWRPQSWEELVGQPHVVQTLRNAVTGDRVAHAYLFAGPRGTGKTTAARLLAKAVNCLAEDPAARPCNQCTHCTAVNTGRFLDLIEIDAASNTSVEDVRDLREKINFSPNQGKYKVYIIDEVHMLSNSAFNALLKTLEEPPAHVIFVLATTEIHKIPATVLSRCQRHEFRRVPVNEIVTQLQKIVSHENMSADPAALTLIARQSAGGMRDAISLLDQMASTGKEISLELTQSVLGTAASQAVFALVDAIQQGQPSEGMKTIHAALDAGADARLLARQAVDYLRALLLIQMGNGSQVDLASDTRAQAEKQAKASSAQEILRMIKAFNTAASEVRGGWQPSLPLELALVEVLETPPAPAPQVPPAREQPASPAVSGKPAATTLFQRANPPAAAGKPPTSTPDQGATSPAGSPPQKAKMQIQETAPAARSETPTQAEGGKTLETVRKAWTQIRDRLKPQDQNLVALLNSCKLLEVKNGALVLGFGSDTVRDKMDKPNLMDLTSQAIFDVTGVHLKIRCELTRASKSVPADVKADGMVAAAIKHGGEIVDIQE